MWDGYTDTIVPSHQHAILGPAQIRDAHSQPQSDGRQCHGEREGREVCQHAMAEIVRFIPLALIARQIVRLLQGVFPLSMPAKTPSAQELSARATRELSTQDLSTRACSLTRREGLGARAEFEHAVLFLRRYGPLGFHCCQLRGILTLFSTPAARLAENVDMPRMRKSIPPKIYPSIVSWNRP
jgi:hypothetical protein